MLFNKCLRCIALILVVLVSAYYCCKPRGSLKVELVQVVFRHGERTPQKDEVKLIPNATQELAEPWGYSQLTNRGKRQEYLLGKVLRQLYSNFLGDAYVPENVFAVSTDYDRTKVSLQLVLAGLYSPSDALIWSPELKWNPIPIHFVPSKLDALMNLFKCDRLAELWKKLMRSDEMQERLRKYDDLFAYLRRFFPNVELDIEQLFYLHNVIVIEKSLNVSHSEWYSPVVHERIREAAKFYLDTLSYTPELIRLNGGSLTRRMLENMESHDRTREKPRKIYLYSGHEFTVYALAKAHNITLKLSPSYGTAFILEKLRDEAGKLFVKINYWIGNSEELVLLKLNGCGKLCPFEKYRRIIASSLSSDQDMRCLIENLSTSDLEKILNSDMLGLQS